MGLERFARRFHLSGKPVEIRFRFLFLNRLSLVLVHHGEIPERVCSVRVDVVFRLVSEYSVLLVEFSPVSSEPRKSYVALSLVEVAIREHVSDCVYSI